MNTNLKLTKILQIAFDVLSEKKTFMHVNAIAVIAVNSNKNMGMTEEEFILALEDRCYFRNLLESNANDPKLPVKFSYMRRRVCHKLFKVFSKLVKNFFKQIII